MAIMKCNALACCTDSYDSYYLPGWITEALKYVVITDMITS